MKFYLSGKLGKNKFTLIDKEDFERVSTYKWYFDGRYVINYGYVSNGVHLRLHRFITEAPKGLIVHHINNNKLDNRKSNLLICTQKHHVTYSRRTKPYIYTNWLEKF